MKNPSKQKDNISTTAAPKKTKKGVVDTFPLPDIYYDPAKGYWIKDKHQIWMQVPEKAVKRHLKEQGFGGASFQGQNSQVDSTLVKIEAEHRIDYAGPLAGHGPGVRRGNGRTILVTRGPDIIKAIPGDCPHLARLFESMFRQDQLPFVYGWLKVGYENLVDCIERQATPRPGQAFVMAGPANSGKSLVQSLVTAILGGRRAYPFPYLSRKTDFNSDLCQAESLVIDDEFGSSDYKSRLAIAAGIKNLLVSPGTRCHPKGGTAFEVFPFCRLTICVNDNEESLRVLPPITDDIEDKLLLFKVSPADINRTLERDEFMKLLVSELPAFIYFLVTFSIPEEAKGQRFGIGTYHNQDILDSISGLAPETRLHELLLMCSLHPHRPHWEGSAAELQCKLSAKEGATNSVACDLLRSASSCGQLLGRLEDKYPGMVKRLPRKNNVVQWRITLPSERGPGEPPTCPHCNKGLPTK